MIAKFEQQFRQEHPETIGETDSHFDLDNYKDWLEEKYSALLQQVSGVNTENDPALPIHIVRVSTWENATEEQKQPFYDKAVELASDTMFCTRVWSAWGYGTMTEEDFSDATEDFDFIDAIAKAIWEGY